MSVWLAVHDYVAYIGVSWHVTIGRHGKSICLSAQSETDNFACLGSSSCKYSNLEVQRLIISQVSSSLSVFK